jgi:hypothetical protein
MNEPTYQSYRKLYKQRFTIPLGPAARFVGNVPVDFGHIITYVIIVLINASIYAVFLGDRIFFGVGRVIWSMIFSVPITYYLFKLDTVNQPLHLFLIEFVKFPFRKHWSTAFIPFDKPKTVKLSRDVSYRPMISDGSETGFLTLPVVGKVDKIEGLHLKAMGATKIAIHPLTKNIQIQVGDYENIYPRNQKVHRFRKTILQVGRGEIRFIHRNGRVQGVYEPGLGEEEGIHGESSH